MENKEQQVEVELLNLVPVESRPEICRAIDFVKKRHAGQIRPGGETQFLHTLRVAKRAAEFARAKQPADLLTLVRAALGHDLLEDTRTAKTELIEQFGAEVAEIVEAVSITHEDEPDASSLQRVVAGGPLAILTKRFDRLDNVSNLASAPARFRAEWVPKVRAGLATWQQLDSHGAAEIDKILQQFE